MIKQIKEDRVIKLFLDRIYNTSKNPRVEHYYVDKCIDGGKLYNQLRIANVNKDSKIIFLFFDAFPFYNKNMHSKVLNYFSKYKGFEIDIFSIRYGTVKIDDLE